MANRKLLLGSLFVLLWMLMMLFFYHQYVSMYYGYSRKTTFTNSPVDKELPFAILCNNTSTSSVKLDEQDALPPQSQTNVPPTTMIHNPCFGIKSLLNYSHCPLSKSFKVFFYNFHFPSLFSLHNPSLIGKLKALLVNHASWANSYDEACVFLAIVGPLKSNLTIQEVQDKLHNLPYWESSGANHLLVDLEVNSTLDRINTSSAIIANNGALSKPCEGVLNLNIPPSINVPWALDSVPSIFDTLRRHLLYVEIAPQLVEGALAPYKNPALLAELKFKVTIGCEDDRNISKHERKLGLCQPSEKRFHQCIRSTFYLVLGSKYLADGDIATSAHLLEALRCGAVPVIAGVDRLPFGSVLNWHKAAILLPTLPPPNTLCAMLSSLQPQVIMEYRRQGQFLVNTYFLDQELLIYTSTAILRALFYHPPPPSVDFDAKTIELTNARTVIPPSPRFLNNFSSVYSSDMWNCPPGPFYMYPVTPYNPPYTPDMFHEPTSNKEQTISLGHIQGKEFRAKLFGNYPPEGFTVVALTYHRTKHLPSFLSNFKNCPFLAKIVLVWNNDEDPPGDMSWPDIGVPVEVVIVGRNSLNNRFLPFSNIETEAVLALDDDQLVPFNQLELAFRVWRENRDRIVGWYDRTAVWDADDPQWKYVWNPSCQTSMTLTGAAMFHKYYLYLYSYWMPQAARDLVDIQMNGEDIAMNFLIAYVSRKPPIKIDLKGDLHACKECEANISLVKGHLNHRKECINTLVKIWGYSTLLSTQFRAEPLLGSSKCI